MDIDLKTLHWLAGLLEGEGSFKPSPPSAPNTPAISVMMTDEDIIARVAAIFGTKYHVIKPRQEGAKIPYAVNLKGFKAYTLMRQLYPLMSKRRQAQIDRALRDYTPNPLRHTTEAQVRDIKSRLAKGEAMIDIARTLGIHYEIIRSIKNGKSWRHIVTTSLDA
ncbi:MAG: hypothetical protein SF162_12520 [bacterium]|nr:hypothetical protein [bacterium]